MSALLSIFNECIEVILNNEGGFQRNPDDPGNWVGGFRVGRLVGTKYGIAAKFFPDVDIPNLTREQAKQIYYDHYWKRLGRIREINNPEVILQIFDFGVNAGVRLAVKRAQKLAGVASDGRLGPNTVAAINHYCGDFLWAYRHDRKVYYEYLSEKYTWAKTFLSGWVFRVEHTKLFS